MFAFAFFYEILVLHVAVTGFAEEPGSEITRYVIHFSSFYYFALWDLKAYLFFALSFHIQKYFSNKTLTIKDYLEL